MYFQRLQNFGNSRHPPPLVRISRNLSVLFVHKIRQFLNLPPSVRTSYVHGPKVSSISWHNQLNFWIFLPSLAFWTRFIERTGSTSRPRRSTSLGRGATRSDRWELQIYRVSIWTTGWPIWSVKTSRWLGFGILCHLPGQQVTTAAKAVGTKSLEVLTDQIGHPVCLQLNV